MKRFSIFPENQTFVLQKKTGGISSNSVSPKTFLLLRDNVIAEQAIGILKRKYVRPE